jgi:hypothetical protein
MWLSLNMGTVVTNQNSIHEEIKEQGNACHYGVVILPSRLLLDA